MVHYFICLLLVAFATVLVTSTSAYGDQVVKFRHVNYEEPPKMGAKLILDSQSRRASLRNDSLAPVIFWHGMGDTAYGSINIDRLALQRTFPGLTVLSVQIGSNVMEDELSGYFGNLNRQIESVCEEILSNELIKKHGSFNAVGFSQGSQFLRGLIQRCPFRENGIKVKNFIALGGQHQGVFGLPNCFEQVFCDHIRQLLTYGAYEKEVQEYVVQAQYWHDPTQQQEYLSKSSFLADINNENQVNQTYKQNLLALDNMILVEFLQDEMVVPKESSLFGFFEHGQSKKIVPLEGSQLYLEDRLGLRALAESGRLHLISIPGGHLQYSMTWFINEIASVYLGN